MVTKKPLRKLWTLLVKSFEITRSKFTSVAIVTVGTLVTEKFRKRLLARLHKHVIGHICHGEPLLVRYDVFHSRWLRIYFHNHRRSDIDRDMHDHPWSFVSLLLTGSYIEHTPQGSKLLTAGMMIYRPAHWVHNLELKEPMWTLIFCGPKRREWGFHTPSGWVLWKKYDSIGKNCE